MPADNSHALARAARQRSHNTRARAEHALAEFEAARQPASVTAIAAHAGISRSWLYTQPELRERIAALHHTGTTTPSAADSPPASEASLRQRLAAANERIRELKGDNAALREKIATILGHQRADRLQNNSVDDTVHDTKPQVTQHKHPDDQR